MPQMMPMNWFLPSFLMLSMMSLMFINMNFMFTINTPSKKNYFIYKNNKIWMW
uniref:ATP synthase F0 subunit 8 n=1 Tax=Ammothea hilgendorfi TaxID=258330 RepID=E0XLF6_AMMHI|nr:ATP synthase F0 subunit 8 [Ammothea hilgendorfi]